MSNQKKIGVCATGKGPYTRSELVEKINSSENYYWIESINDSVKILLCEDPTANSSKLTKAKAKGIQLVKYSDFDFGSILDSQSNPRAEKVSHSKETEKKSSAKKAKDTSEADKLKTEKMKKRIEEGILKYQRLPKLYTNSLGMDFVLIPPGEYTPIAQKDKSPQETIYITEPFYMGKFPVTRGELLAIKKKTEYGDLDRSPVDFCVKDDIIDFILKLENLEKREYSLPTKVEWEYAANAGNEYFFTKGKGSNKLDDYAWTKENSVGIVHPVGSKLPNSWNLYDNLGNVSELCLDYEGEDGYQIYSRGGSVEKLVAESMEIHEKSKTEVSGFRLVLRDLEISADELNLSENRRKSKEERYQFLQKWEESRDERNALFKKLPKEYTNSLGMEFVLIPAGEFLMGAVPQDRDANENEKPQQFGIIPKPFYMGKYPVTQEEWGILMGENPSRYKNVGILAPIENISRKEIAKFIKILKKMEGKNYRLPSEEEWEYSARGIGSATPPSNYFIYTYGDDPSLLGDYAWYKENSNNTTHPVGKKKPNAFGLYDMMGNVREYCEQEIIRSNSFDENHIEGRISKRESAENSTYCSFRLILTDLDISEKEIQSNKEVSRKLKEERKRQEEEKKRQEEEKKRQEKEKKRQEKEKKRQEKEKKRQEKEKKKIENDRIWEESRDERHAIFEKLPKEITNSLGMEFVLIPAGEFIMGAVPQDKGASDSEKPQHKVRITKPFYIGKYPVTQGEWKGLMGNNPSHFKRAGKRAPVESVSWKDCQEFIEKLNQKEGKVYRLPTEAEWEYSARGKSSLNRTDHTIYTYGDDPTLLGDYAWFCDNSKDSTPPVGEKKPNERGLYDMMGNVDEWCEDWYDENYYKVSPIYDPINTEKGGFRVLRGGSWDRDAGRSRLSSRGSGDPDNRLYDRGFRLVLLP